MLNIDNIPLIIGFAGALTAAAVAYSRAVREEDEYLKSLREDSNKKVMEGGVGLDEVETGSLDVDSERTVSMNSKISRDPDFVAANPEIRRSLSEKLSSEAIEALDEINKHANNILFKPEEKFKKLVGRLQGNRVGNFLRDKGMMKSSIEISEGEATAEKIQNEINDISANLEDMRPECEEHFAKRCEMYASQWHGSRTPRGVIFEDLKLCAQHGPYSKEYILGKLNLLSKSFEKRGGDDAKLTSVKNEIEDLKTKVESFFKGESFLKGELTEDKMNSMVKMNTQIDKYLNQKLSRTPRVDAIQSLGKTLSPAEIDKMEGPENKM